MTLALEFMPIYLDMRFRSITTSIIGKYVQNCAATEHYADSRNVPASLFYSPELEEMSSLYEADVQIREVLNCPTKHTFIKLI
jgi:hypothetical protein